MSTGAGFGTRQLYTDSDEVVFDIQRPVILNRINDLATRGDLLDRSIPLVLPVIQGGDYRAESEFKEAFEAARPDILGGLLSAVSGTLAQIDSVQLASLPRTADFARLGVATEKALGWTTSSAPPSSEVILWLILLDKFHSSFI